MQEATVGTKERPLLERLAGRTCEFCSSGSLAREQYNGNDAVVCRECGTPTMQLY
ncbi:HVO_A0556 family zinc finger protein [Halovivax limisalsi]|uniref:HVO_A0556 family zinc finger protein n=1 Tax=Halovivax limisalsi TaxID=1453760 RepID=UPI0031B8B1F9